MPSLMVVNINYFFISAITQTLFRGDDLNLSRKSFKFNTFKNPVRLIQVGKKA